MAFNIIALCNYIANITPASMGVIRIFDLDEVPDEIQPRDCPCLWPNVNRGVWSAQEVQRLSYGPGGTTSTQAKKNLIYTVRYRMCYAPVGSGRNELRAHLRGMATAASALITYVIGTDFSTNSTGVVEFHPQGWTQAGTVQDPSGKDFHGLDFDFYCLEFGEVTA